MIALAVSAARRSRRFLAALACIGPPVQVPGMSVDDLDLLAALGRLPLRYREVLVLRYLAAPPTTTTVRGLRILEPRAGTVVHPGQRVRMRGVGCPPGGSVWFEEGTSLRAGPDGGFTTTFEIPPGPTGDFFLDATCGGATREVRLRREP
jgi:hypothetical protein